MDVQLSSWSFMKLLIAWFLTPTQHVCSLTTALQWLLWKTEFAHFESLKQRQHVGAWFGSIQMCYSMDWNKVSTAKMCGVHVTRKSLGCHMLYVNHFSLGYQMSYSRPFQAFGDRFSSSRCLLCMLIQRQLFHATPLGQAKSRQRMTRESVARIYGIILWPFSNDTATLPPLGHFFNAASAHWQGQKPKNIQNKDQALAVL